MNYLPTKLKPFESSITKITRSLSPWLGMGLIVMTSTFARSQSFTEIPTSLPGVSNSSVAWGDVDNDGDLDLIVIGYDAGGNPISKIYRNDNGTFIDISAPIASVAYGSVALADYNNDGWLDILLTGYDLSFTPITKIYRNDNGNFVDIEASLTGVANGSAVWGDFNNDGYQDILLTGVDVSNTPISKVYWNNNGNFVDGGASLTGVSYSSVAVADYDNDGDLDLLLTGYDASYQPISVMYRNDHGTFILVPTSLIGVSQGSVAFGDYDNDGDMDLLLTGVDATSNVIGKVYRNDGGNFIDTNAQIAGVYNSSVAWGDYDNDGYLDILMTGTNGERIIKIYHNDAGVRGFSPIILSLPGVEAGSAAWGDFNKDGTLDIALTGMDRLDIPILEIYQNNSGTANSAPQKPTNLNTAINGNSVNFMWNISLDSLTSRNGLTYNLQIGTTTNNIQVLSPMSDLQTGYRKVPKFGNTDHNTSWTINNFADGAYQWSVQAIDNSMVGSEFAVTKGFSVNANPPLAPKNLVAIAGDGQVTLQWNRNTEGDFLRYRIFGGTSSNPVTRIDSVSVISDTTKTITGLTNGTTYYYRLTAVDNAYNESGFSNQVVALPKDITAPAAPKNLVAIAGDGQVTLRWNKNTEGDFLRYRIFGGTSSNPVTRIDSVSVISDTTKTITGLTNGTTYYYRLTAVDNAYNESGFSNQVVALPKDITAPEPALNLGASPSTTIDKEIQLTWTSSTSGDVAHYLIYRSRATIVDTTGKLIATVGLGTNYLDETTIYGKFYYKVFAVDLAGNISLASNEANAKSPDHIKPQPATSMTATPSTYVDKLVQFSWTSSVDMDVSNYLIYCDTAPFTDTTGKFVTKVGRVTSYSRYENSYGTSYSVVFAVDSAGNVSDVSNQAIALIPNFTSPNPPTSLMATASVIVDKGIDLTWTASTSTGVNNYVIYASTETIVDTTGKRLGLAGNVTSFSDIAANYTRCFYKVFAITSSGIMSDASNEASAVAPDHLNPQPATSLAATASQTKEKKITLIWSASTSTDVTNYSIYRDMGLGSPSGLVATVGKVVTYNDTTPTFGTFFYRVLAVDGSGNTSTPSNEAGVVNKPFAPKITTAIYQNAAMSKYLDIAVVSEAALQQAPLLKVWKVQPHVKDTTQVSMVEINSSTKHYRGPFELSTSGQYTFSTRAITLTGGDSTQTRSMGVELASPGQSSKLTSLNGKAQLGIMENSVQEKTYFLSDYHADGNEVIYHFGPEKEFSQSLSLELSYDPHLYPEATKLFIFQKEDGQWNPVRSQVYPEEKKIKTHISKLGDFKVAYDANYSGSNIVPSVFALQQNYPNPFNPSTNIAYNLPEDGQLVITIYNLLGQQVKTIYNGFQYAGNYTITWDATNANGQAVSSGIYFYRVQAGRVLQTKKMTLMR